VTPHDFIQKWSISELKERSGSQEHFIDLCRMLGQRTPAEADPKGEWYTFEKGASKYGGGDGWADVWMRGHFAWEYKGKHKDLGAAYGQLLRYRESLENPPLLVVCDMARFEVHTNFTGTLKHVYALDLAGVAEEENRRVLRCLFEAPEELKPGKRVEEATEEAAREFASLAQKLRDRGHEPRLTAHFLNRLLFCLFAEDVGLLPRRLFLQILEAGLRDPREFSTMLAELFQAMAHGGRFGVERVHFFNGNLYQDAEILQLTADEIHLLKRIARLDWSQIEPAIFGTLFERGLDPSKRSQLGAHYTDRRSILRVVEPVLMGPLRRAWAEARLEVDDLLAKAAVAMNAATETRHRKRARDVIEAYRTDVLDVMRVLDPACGSGNFLYIALELLHKLEKEVLLALASVERGQTSMTIRVGPHMVRGIEVNPFAQELAQVTIWIGHFQWQLKNGFAFETNPVLKPLDNIELRDAILDLNDPANPAEPEWPDAEVIIGNPPFLGAKLLRANLGNDYVEALFRMYGRRIPGMSDLVCYWYEKARAMVEAGRVKRVGLLATQGIRGGASRRVLERVKESGDIFLGWSDEPWVLDGAAVHVSFVGFDDGSEKTRVLNGSRVTAINANLTSGVDLTKARRLKENRGIAFVGDVKGGAFDIPEALALEMFDKPTPHRKSNREVLRPWVNGLDITRRPRRMWIIDFGVDMEESEAALYEAPFEYVREHVLPERRKVRRKTYREHWWLHVEPCSGMRNALTGLKRYIGTPTLTKFRLFVWLPAETLADHQLITVARDDDYTFGILHSRPHELWSLRKGTQLETRPRYTPTSTFETFPFPRPTEAQRQPVAAAAAELDRLRAAWLDPVGADPAELKPRTMTALYNQRPTWLANAHAVLDAAVAAAYGWPADMTEDDVLAALLELNLEREPA